MGEGLQLSSATPSDSAGQVADVTGAVQDFIDACDPLERHHLHLHVLVDARTGARYCECHMRAQGIIALGTIDVPVVPGEQQLYFSPSYRGLDERDRNWLSQMAANLKRTLIFRNGVMPLGLLAFCLQHARDDGDRHGGVFASVRQRFAPFKGSQLAARLNHIKEFRNAYVAHPEHELLDPELARSELRNWISGLAAIYRAHHAG